MVVSTPLHAKSVISTANLTIQFGAKPLFENVSIKFGEGNRYGLIGANGSGKSTFMKILGGELEATSGNVTLPPNTRMATLNQNQFGFEQFSVLDPSKKSATKSTRCQT